VPSYACKMNGDRPTHTERDEWRRAEWTPPSGIPVRS
jgi:hypothetical protein